MLYTVKVEITFICVHFTINLVAVKIKSLEYNICMCDSTDENSKIENNKNQVNLLNCKNDNFLQYDICQKMCYMDKIQLWPLKNQ